MNSAHYDNEGFLYINKHATETFKKGEIRDINDNIICPGVIVPIINPIEEATREPTGDEHLISIDSCLTHITHYYPLQRGKKLRIYWDHINNIFMISTEHKIYVYNDGTFQLETVNFDLLDKTVCYYAIMSSDEKKLILTNMVKKDQPDLAASYNIAEDLAFVYHIDDILQMYMFESTANLSAFKRVLKEDLEKFANGFLFILDDGRQIEYRNRFYNYYCMLEKPEPLSLYIYYIYCLNKYATGTNLMEYFKSLHEFITEYLQYFPEHKEVFQSMTRKIMNFVDDLREKQEATDLEAIDAVNKLLELEPESLLQLLLKY